MQNVAATKTQESNGSMDAVVDDIGLEIPNIPQGFREFPTGRCKRRCKNEQQLIELWQQVGEQIDEQRLGIFRLMETRQQAELLEVLQ